MYAITDNEKERTAACNSLRNHTAVHILGGESNAVMPCQLCGTGDEVQEGQVGCSVAVWKEKKSTTVNVEVNCATLGKYTYRQKASNKSSKVNQSSNVSFWCFEDGCATVVSKMNLKKHYEEKHPKCLDSSQDDVKAREEYYNTDEKEKEKMWLTGEEQEHLRVLKQSLDKKHKKGGKRKKSSKEKGKKK